MVISLWSFEIGCFYIIYKWWSSWKSRHIQVARRTRLERPEAGTTYPCNFEEGCIETVFLEATETCWCWNWRLATFLLRSNTSSPGVRLPSLTTPQSKTLESLQKRAMNIIFPNMDYKLSLIMARIDTLEAVSYTHLTLPTIYSV